MRRTVLVSQVAGLPAGRWLAGGLAAGVLAVGLLAGCATGPGSAAGCGNGARARAGDAGYAEVLALSAPTADYAWYPETVTSALPSVTYTDASGDAHASELAAVGRFTAWEEGEREYPSVRVIDLTFEVGEVVDALGDLSMLEGGTVTVHVSVTACADVGRVADELVALGDVVLFLNHVGPEPWPPPEWINVFGGAFLGDVHDDGTVTWPVADAIAANNPADAHPEADAATLEDLRTAATEERTVDLAAG
ncbi:hypothetical protein [Promicromonospora sp. NPDC060271]|uniref:hypothetical protein n=1 Tax=Promicromonospora sp. NPDC060271 TaxID=3347089 RepID=UPI00364F2096